MLISVITPAYNEEKNINKCYQSLCEQTLTNFEWIIIDDGSTDKTVDIVENIIKLHNQKLFNIKLLKQNNSGILKARELGLKSASGSWICNLDADDYLSSDALELAVDKVSDSVDAVYFNLEHISPKGILESKFKYSIDTWPVTGKIAFGECIDGYGVSGLGMFKTELYNDAFLILEKSPSIITSNLNDEELISRYIMYNAKFVEHCEGTYYYVSNPNSITRRVNSKFHKMLYTAIKLDNFIQDKKDKDIEEYPDWDLKSQLHLLYDFTGVWGRYMKWRDVLDNKDEWKKSLYTASNHINLSKILINYKRVRIISVFGYRYVITGSIKVLFTRFAGFILNLKKA